MKLTGLVAFSKATIQTLIPYSKMKSTLLAIVAVALFPGISLFAAPRTWTDAATGRTLEGEIKEISGKNVEIVRANGSKVTLEIARLSDEDQAFVESVQKEQAAAGAAEAEYGREYGIRGIPAVFLIGKDGTVVSTNVRGSNLERELEQHLP